MSFLRKILVIMAFNLCLVGVNRAQCSGCTINVTNNSINYYMVGPNTVLCISPGLTYSGIIDLKGGVVCNSGYLLNGNLHIESGTLENYGDIAYNSPLNVAATGNIKLNLHPRSHFTCSQIFDLNSSDSLIVVIDSSATFSLNSFSSSNARLVFSQKSISLGGTGSLFEVTNFLDCTGTSGVDLVCGSNNSFDVGSMLIDNSSNNSVVNFGNMNFGSFFEVANSNNVDFDNFGSLTATDFRLNSVSNCNNYCTSQFQFVISKMQLNHIQAVFNNNTNINVNEFDLSQGLFNGLTSSAALFSTMNISGGLFSNMGDAFVSGVTNITGGTLTNNYSFKAQSLVISGGVFNNQDYSGISADMTLISPAVFNNNYRTEVAGTIRNGGKIVLGQRTSLATVNLYNETSGYLEGPSGIPDSSKYGIIFVKNTSDNLGHINKCICFVDFSYSGTSQYRIDNIHSSASWIEMPPVVFKLTGGIKGPGGPVTCPYSVFFSPNSGINICQNSSISFVAGVSYMSSNFSLLLTATNPYVWSATPPQPAAASGGAMNSVYTHPGVQSSFALSVSTNYENCPLTSALVNVNVQNLFANAGPTKFIVQGGSTSIGGSPSAYGTSSNNPPFTYAWSPGGTFVAPSTSSSPNPIVAPSVTTTYQLQVSSQSSGCIAKSNMTVIVESAPHAVLKRSLDAGYYKVVTNNSLYFKYDDEYGVTGNLTYRIYKQDHSSANPAYSCPNLTPVYGDNRFSINLSNACVPGIAPSVPPTFYVLEVLNEKNEKYYLKFLY